MELYRADVEGAMRWPLPNGTFLTRQDIRRAAIETGRPIALDETMRPGSLLGEYIRERNLDLQPESILQYAYELRMFEEFLRQHEADATTATSRHLHLYRVWRTEQQEAPIGSSAWKRSASAVRGYLQWVAAKEGIRDDPSHGGQFRSPLWGRPAPEEKIRALTSDQWRSFRDFGIRGYGSMAGSQRQRTLQNSGRLRVGAELALTTGMRLQEFSTLTLWDVGTRNEDSSKTLHLEACSKYGAFRTATLIPRVRSLIDLYVRSERSVYAPRTSRFLGRNHKRFFVIQSLAPIQGTDPRLVGVLNGEIRKYQLRQIPPHLRQIMVHEGPDGLEFANLFLSRTGEPLGRHSWFRDFHLASQRALTTVPPNGPALQDYVRPHDLRHTFAVQLLRQLMKKVRTEGRTNSQNLHEHLAWNPILTVQRMLGHRQPSTTLKYLRYMEDVDGVLADAWEGWNDPSVSFADYADSLWIGN